MTDTERMFARAVAPSLINYWPGSRTKRFAADMAQLEHFNPGKDLTPRQAVYLRQLVVRYRRQIPADIVSLAKRDLAELEGQAV